MKHLLKIQSEFLKRAKTRRKPKSEVQRKVERKKESLEQMAQS